MRKCLLVAIGLLSATVANAKTNTLVNGASDWSLPGSFAEDRTLEPGDVVVINAATTGTVYDASAAIVSSLDRVILTVSNTSCLIVDVSTNTTFGCTVNDGRVGNTAFGTVIKRGAGEAYFSAYTRTNDPDKPEYVRDFAVRLIVEAGAVRLPDLTDILRSAEKEKTYFYVPYITLSANARIFTPGGCALLTKYLYGYGTVTNDYGHSSKYDRIHISYDVPAGGSLPHSDFYGRLCANGYASQNIAQVGRINLLGTNSTFTGVFEASEYSSNPSAAWSGIALFGMSGNPSSIGVHQNIFLSASRLIYLGHGETTDKHIFLRSSIDAPAILDGGEHGGLTLAGNIYNGTGANSALHRRLVLTGDNTNACVILGEMTTRLKDGTYYSHHLTKSGRGVWHLNRAATGMLGGIAVEDGILRFNTIAEKGVDCSLGKATVLTSAYAGTDYLNHLVDYAFLLGGNGTVGTLEHVGPAAAESPDRPVAVKSSGRLVANGGALTIGDIYGLGTGAKTFTLDGSNTAANVAIDIRDGDGTLSVAKDGTGTWILTQSTGAYGFTGALNVNGGTLKVVGNHSGQPFNRFRLWLKENAYANGGYSEYYGADASTRNFMLHRFALFDAAGNAQTPDLAVQPTGSTLAPGQHAYMSAARLESGAISGDTSLAWLFAGTDPSMRCTCKAKTDLDVNKRSTWVAIDMYLTNGTPAIATLDFSCYYAHDKLLEYAARQNPTAMALEGSVDGLTWESVWEETNIPIAAKRYTFVKSNKAAGSAENLAKALVGNTGGAPLTHSYPAKSSGLLAATSFSVASNATLRTDGAALAFANGVTWRVSAAGGGTLQGFTLPANGTLDVSDLPPNAAQLKLPVTCVDVVGLGNVAGWSLVSGASDLSSRWSVVVRNGELWMFRRGLRVIIQ